ncbi:ATP-binding protein [Burkholderia sp. MR1-5-21]
MAVPTTLSAGFAVAFSEASGMCMAASSVAVPSGFAAVLSEASGMGIAASSVAVPSGFAVVLSEASGMGIAASSVAFPPGFAVVFSEASGVLLPKALSVAFSSGFALVFCVASSIMVSLALAATPSAAFAAGFPMAFPPGLSMALSTVAHHAADAASVTPAATNAPSVDLAILFIAVSLMTSNAVMASLPANAVSGIWAQASLDDATQRQVGEVRLLEYPRCAAGRPPPRPRNHPVATCIGRVLEWQKTLRFPEDRVSGAAMIERQSAGPQIRLLDLIDAMRQLRSAVCPGERSAGIVTDARGAALAILTADGAFVAVNRSAAALLGYSSTDLVGKRLVDLAPEDVHAELTDKLSGSVARQCHSFDAVLNGRTGHSVHLVLHQQALPATETGVSLLLTLFEEPLTFEPEPQDAAEVLDASARTRQACLLMGQQKERHRLAAELHDGLGQALTLIKLMNEDALMRLRRGEIGDAANLLDATVLRIRETIGEVRQICGELRPPILDKLGLPAALASLCRRIERDTETLSVEFNCDVDDDDVPEHLKADMFRVAQEALNNIVKHAQATEISLGLRHDAGGVLLTIQDNGIGYESHPLMTEDAHTTGLGLIGMQHRVESHGGTFSIRSSATTGTLVSAAWAL